MDCSAAIAGHPVLHSLSPALCQDLLASEGLEGAYTRLAAASAPEALSLAQRLGLDLLQLTSPFKERVIASLAGLSPLARRVGAVNAVRLSERTGHNTDVLGVRAMLREAGLHRGRVAVLGAGGAARAAVVALQEQGITEIVLVNRTPTRARRVAAQLGCEWAPLPSAPEVLAPAAAVLCCVPGGALSPALCALGQGPWLDASYTAPERAGACAELGRPYLDGRTWLAAQARAALALITGAPPSSEALPALPAGPPRPSMVALLGVSGAGKTEVAPRLAARLGIGHADVDQEVERLAGRPLHALWAAEGEARFRDLEQQVAEALLSGPEQVVALGGGSLEAPPTRRLAAARALRVWLWCDAEVAAVRARAAPRPLLQQRRLAELLEARRPTYLRAADLVLDTTHAEPEEVARHIAAEIRATWPRGGPR